MPKSRGRKRPRPRTPRPTPQTWQAAILRAAKPLLDPATSRHAAQVWASKQLGDAFSGPPRLRDSRTDAWITEMCRYASHHRTREAAALVVALGAVLDTDAVKEACATWARARVADLPWTESSVGLPHRVTRSDDAWADETVWFLEYDDHMLCVITARSRSGAVTELKVSSPELLRAWDALSTAAGGRDWTPRTEVHVDDALRAVAFAAAVAEAPAARLRESSWRELAHLLHARLSAVPREAPPTPRAVDPAELEALVSAFFTEVGLSDTEQARDLLEPLLEFSEEYLAHDLFAWSPHLVAEFLLRWAPGFEWAEPGVATALPKITRHWVEWALRSNGLASDTTAEAAIVALDLGDMFLRRHAQAIEDLNGEQWGDDELEVQQGPAA